MKRNASFFQLMLLMALATGCGLTDKDPGTEPPAGLKIVLNEVLAKGSTSDDWVELKNLGEEQVDLGGMILDDGTDKWTFAAGTKIAAGGYQVVFADGSGVDGKANFKLSAGGETLKLFDSSGVLLDEVTFGEQQEDISWARLPDGTGDWQALAPPTPGAMNEAPDNDGSVPQPDGGVPVPDGSAPDQGAPDLEVDTGAPVGDGGGGCSNSVATAKTELVINEVFSNGLTDPDWIELKNNGGACFDLSGYLLSDDKADAAAWSFPAGTEIAAGGYLTIIADNDDAPTDGKLHAAFKLSSGGEDLVFSAPASAQAQTIDVVTFPALLEDQSYGRLPDGVGPFALTTIATAGAVNQ